MFNENLSSSTKNSARTKVAWASIKTLIQPCPFLTRAMFSKLKVKGFVRPRLDNVLFSNLGTIEQIYSTDIKTNAN